MSDDGAVLFALLFGVPALLLSIVFAAVSFKAPRGGAALCGMLLVSEIPLLFWANRAGWVRGAGAWLIIALCICAAGLVVALVNLARGTGGAAPKDKDA
jgi:predicted membrane protein